MARSKTAKLEPAKTSLRPIGDATKHLNPPHLTGLGNSPAAVNSGAKCSATRKSTTGKSTGSIETPDSPVNRIYRSPLGIPVSFQLENDHWSPLSNASWRDIEVQLAHADLQLLRGFDQLLSLEGLNGVEHLPHQIETVRKVLRRFKGRVLLADEVGLGKTIEACLLLREYLLRGFSFPIRWSVNGRLNCQRNFVWILWFHLADPKPNERNSGPTTTVSWCRLHWQNPDDARRLLLRPTGIW
jgi:hypothetical protein